MPKLRSAVAPRLMRYWAAMVAPWAVPPPMAIWKPSDAAIRASDCMPTMSASMIGP